jgi:hypothetical protein
MDVEVANGGSRPATTTADVHVEAGHSVGGGMTSIGDSSGEEKKNLEAWPKGASVPKTRVRGEIGQRERKKAMMTSAARRHGNVRPSQSHKLA